LHFANQPAGGTESRRGRQHEAASPRELRREHRAALCALEREAIDLRATAFSIGHIAIGCALSYLDFRFAAEDWRNAHPQLAVWHATFAGRASARATEPVDDR
jgi:hypothetical protein